MDRAIVERAVEALTALNHPHKVQGQSKSAAELSRKAEGGARLSQVENRAVCGSSHCAGCYEVEPGSRIHPPKAGQEWKDWLLRWEPKGRVQ